MVHIRRRLRLIKAALMDNFKRPGRARRQAVLDGIIRKPASGPLTRQSPLRSEFATPRSKSTVGDFRQANGFHGNRQPALASAGGVAVPALEQSIPKIKLSDRPRRRNGMVIKKRSWKKIALRTSLAMVSLVVLAGGFLIGKGYLKARNIFKGGGSAAALQENVDPTQLKGEGDGRINILVLGKGGPGHDGPDLTDTLLVASIDPVNKEASLLSVPRDLWVQANNSSMKINSVYATAKEAALYKNPKDTAGAEAKGLKAIEDTISQTMGIPIHYHAMVDFEAFREAIDAVGGVSINVPETLSDPTIAWENHNNPVIAPKGWQLFDGHRALLYARSRHGSARGDFDRAERQRAILLALKDKVVNLGTFANPLKISQLLDAFGNHVQVNMTQKEMLKLYSIGKDIPGSKVHSVGLADPPNDYVTTSTIGGLSVVVPKAGTFDYSAIQAYVRNELKDSYIKNENANLTVLNGSGIAGLAAKKTTELKSFGYTVSVTADAPTDNYTKTVLVDLTKGKKKYTKHYLENRLGVTAVTKLPDATIQPGNADFVIILGSDAS